MLGSAPYSFDVLVAIGWTAFFLMIGAICRTKIPFCRKYLVPACMLGGFIGFLATNTGLLSLFGGYAPSYKTMEFIVYHMFNLTFICFGLSGFGISTAGSAPKQVVKGSIWLACVSNAASSIQAIIAILIVAAWNIAFGTNLLESAGSLVGAGFVGGPGAALANGAIKEQAGFHGMVSLGLACAAIGYLLSIILGIPAAKYIRKKINVTGDGLSSETEEAYGYYKDSTNSPSAGVQKFITSNMDSMSFQVGLVVFCYAIAYGLMLIVTSFFSPKVTGMIWGLFAFLFCLPTGLFVREILLKRTLKVFHLFDQGCHQRILNTFIDFIAVASLVGVSLNILKEWWPILIIWTIVVSFTTMLWIYLMTRYLKPEEYPAERFLGLVGCCTGTVTSGLVLIRMIDPEFKSTVPYQMGLMALPIMAITVPLMPFTTPLSYGQVLYGGTWLLPILSSLLLLAIYLFISLILFRKSYTKKANF